MPSAAARRSARLGRRLARPQRLDGDLGERLVLGPGRLALLVELEQRVERDRDRHPIGAAHRLREGEAAPGQERPQVGQALGHGHLGDRHVADVHRRGHLEQVADRAGQDGRVIDRAGVLERRLAQMRGQRGRAEAMPLLVGEALGEIGRRGAVALGGEQPRQELLGGLAGIEVDLLDLLAGQQQPGLELQQRRDQHQELGGRLEIQLALALEVVDVGDDHVGEVDLQQVHLLAQDEREQEVKRAPRTRRGPARGRSTSRQGPPHGRRRYPRGRTVPTPIALRTSSTVSVAIARALSAPGLEDPLEL